MMKLKGQLHQDLSSIQNLMASLIKEATKDYTSSDIKRFVESKTYPSILVNEISDRIVDHLAVLQSIATSWYDFAEAAIRNARPDYVDTLDTAPGRAWLDGLVQRVRSNLPWRGIGRLFGI